MLKFGVIMDPIESINPKKDTTFSLISSLQKRCRVEYIYPRTMCLVDEKVKAEIPLIRDLFDLVHDDFHKKFNQQFEDDQKNRFEEFTGNPFEVGYSHLMDNDKRDEDEKKPITNNVFSKEIIVYEEPNILPVTYGNNFRLDISDINDFSELEGKLQMNDYVLAHRELENHPTSIKA